MERPRRLRGRWVAVPPGEEPEELHKVDGSVIYFDPDEEDHSPLRDASESLPTDPDWLQATLGLSPEPARLRGDLARRRTMPSRVRGASRRRLRSPPRSGACRWATVHLAAART